MRKFVLLLLLVAIACGGFFFHKHYEIQGIDQLAVVSRNPGETQPGVLDFFGGIMDGGSSSDSPNNLPPAAAGDSIRIASFNIQVFGTSKAAKPQVMEVLSDIIRKFDVVAIQEIRSKDQTIVPRFVEQINQGGRKYEYVLGPRLGRSSSKEQYAFIFDSETIEVDRNACYTVADPSDGLHREPFVGLFRARGPPAESAFTFQLVNIHTDPDEVKQEINALAKVYHQVVADQTQEHDVIILGDLNTSEKKLHDLGRIPGISWAIADQFTNTIRTKSYDNLIFDSRETNEYTGRSGVVDILREYNLTEDRAKKVSDHFPVWAEFSVHEGGSQRVATRPEEAPR